jgi:two-component system sensor histidine kinase ChvG
MARESFGRYVGAISAVAGRSAASAAYAADKVLRWIGSLKPVRFIAGSLLRRILLANLAGLGIMVGGILYFSQYNSWLIDAKREALMVQGEIIAAAIASDARVETGRLVIHADSLPTAEEQQRAGQRDDGFAAMELSIRPERVAPIVRRLIQPTKRRARVYSRDGTLIVDSATLLKRGQLSKYDPPNSDGSRPRTKNFWTRLKAWMIDQELPVYREIGNASGTLYPEVRKALDGTTTAMLLLNEKGEQIVSTAVPIKRASTVQGVLLMSTAPGEIDQILSEERELIWTLSAIALVATLVTSLFLARTVAGPMKRLSEAADHVSRNISARQELPEYRDRSDEVGQMAHAFSAMTAALYRRVEASESFAADVAHELKNPLAAARSMAESLAYAKTEEQRAELVRQIQNEIRRLNRLITDVSDASRLDAELARQQMAPFDVTGVVTSVSQIFRDILSSDSRKLGPIFEPAPFEGAFLVNGDPGRLGQVLTNLVDNAISFSPEGCDVKLTVCRRDSTVELRVDDQGPGILEDRLNIIFDRFYTDRPATEAARGKNSGLGLSISREIVRAHGGEIIAENRYAEGVPTDERKPLGASFIVRLPALLYSSQRANVTSGRRPMSDGPYEQHRERA